MSVEVKGVVEDLGVGLRLQCGTPYALIDVQTGETLYALVGADTKLAGWVGHEVRLSGEARDSFPAAEYEVLEVKEVRHRMLRKVELSSCAGRLGRGRSQREPYG